MVCGFSYQKELVRRIFNSRPDLLSLFERISWEFGGYGSESYLATSISEADTAGNELIWQNWEEICRLLAKFSNCRRWDFNVEGAPIVSFPVRETARMNKSDFQEVTHYNQIPVESPYNHVGKRFYFRLDRSGRYLCVKTPTGEENRLWIPAEQMIGKSIEECLPAELASPRRYYFDTAVQTGEEVVFTHSFTTENHTSAYEVRIIPLGEEVLMICSRLALNNRVLPGLPDTLP